MQFLLKRIEYEPNSVISSQIRVGNILGKCLIVKVISIQLKFYLNQYDGLWLQKWSTITERVLMGYNRHVGAVPYANIYD